jgi:DNA mismatch repair protein PMS2
MDPKCCRPNSDHQWMFLNQRPIQVPRLFRAINEVYRSLNAGLIKSNQFPAFILSLTIPEGEFDVNVTPDKKLIMFHREKEIVAFLQVRTLHAYRFTEMYNY